MMSDRELLELAAKAAGIEWYGMAGDDNDSCAYFDIGPDEVVKWNPLRDDGDALRLAVRLRLWIQISERCAWAQQDSESIVGDAAASSLVMFVDVSNDSCAATRRAIVRAAAEIGKQHD